MEGKFVIDSEDTDSSEDVPSTKKRKRRRGKATTSTKITYCEKCNRGFRHIRGLEDHIKRHDPPGGFKCRYCDDVFCYDQERLDHTEQKHKVYLCRLCQISFESEEIFKQHITLKHDGRDREYLVCENCGKQFKTKLQLNNHNLSQCGTVKKFECNICGQKYVSQWTLAQHKIIHIDGKLFCCSYCGKNFQSRGQLTVHERRHTGEKPYICTICNKSFSHRESLITHSSLHTGVKPYMCGCCEARFSCIGNLIKHRKTRPFTCGLPEYSDVSGKVVARPSYKNPDILTMEVTKKMKPIKVLNPEFQKPKAKTKKTKGKLQPIEKVNIGNSKDESTYDIQIQDFALTENGTEDNTNFAPGTDAGSEIIKDDIIDSLSTSNSPDMSYSWQSPGVDDHQIHSPEPEIPDIKDIKDITEIAAYDSKDKMLPEYFPKTDNDGDNLQVIYKIIEKEEDEEPERKVHMMPDFIPETIIATPSYDTVKKEISDEEEFGMSFDPVPSLLTPIDIPIASTVSTFEAAKPQEENVEDTPPEKTRRKTRSKRETPVKADTPSDKPKARRKRGKRRFKEDFDNYLQQHECDQCPKVYSNPRPYLKHLIVDHNMSETTVFDQYPYLKNCEMPSRGTVKCKVCGKNYCSNMLLKKHEEKHGLKGELIHKCPCCKSYLETLEKVREHVKEEHLDQVTCQQCGRVYSDPEGLTAHIRYSHRGKRFDIKTPKQAYVCQKCGKKFSNKTALSDHERSDCGKKPQYQCDICNKFYHSAGSLKTHRTMHTGERPHCCTICGLGFRTHGQVKVHLRKHSGEKPFKCDTCAKSFAYRESLLTHVSIHTGVKRFICHYCGMRFSCISNLQAHRKARLTTCGAMPLISKAVVGPMGITSEPFYLPDNESDN